MIPGGFVGLSWSFRRHREHFTFELSVDGEATVALLSE